MSARQAIASPGARATERERAWVAALDAWAHGDEELALARHLAIAERRPRDLLNAKIAQVHQINLGDRPGQLHRLGGSTAQQQWLEQIRAGSPASTASRAMPPTAAVLERAA